MNTIQFELKQLIQNLLRDLILLAKRVGQAETFKLNCRKMRMRMPVYQLSQMLQLLLVFITLDPNLSYLNPMHSVIIEVSKTLQEALTLSCTCKRKAISCLLLAGTNSNYFHKLYHLLDVSIAKMNWLFILYNPDVGSAFNEIFLLLPQILTNDPPILSVWSSMITQKMIWELATMLVGEASPMELKICCVQALSMLNVGRVLNSRMIKETKLLMLGLAKFVAGEHGELQRNYLMIIVEITAEAESDLNVRCEAFKTNSPSAKAIVEQLLRVIKESEDPSLQVLAIRSSIGSIARIFCERKNHHAISVLVLQLGSRHREVATEAVMALQKFACPGNYLRKAHSKRMMEFNAVEPLVKLLREGEETEQVEGLVFHMCKLVANVS